MPLRASTNINFMPWFLDFKWAWHRLETLGCGFCKLCCGALLAAAPGKRPARAQLLLPMAVHTAISGSERPAGPPPGVRVESAAGAPVPTDQERELGGVCRGPDRAPVWPCWK